MTTPDSWLEEGERIIEEQNGNFSRSVRRRRTVEGQVCGEDFGHEYTAGRNDCVICGTPFINAEE